MASVSHFFQPRKKRARTEQDSCGKIPVVSISSATNQVIEIPDEEDTSSNVATDQVPVIEIDDEESSLNGDSKGQEEGAVGTEIDDLKAKLANAAHELSQAALKFIGIRAFHFPFCQGCS